MCEYCEQCFDENADLKGFYFTRSGTFFKNKRDAKISKKEKQLGIICHVRSNCKLNDTGPILSIRGNRKDEDDWLDLKINYCPMCGRKLR